MIIANCIFQKRKIYINTKKEFDADYKGHNIRVTRDHGFGKAFDKNKKRFMIDVVDNKAKSFGIYVETYGDFESINDAIIYALHGAMLLPEQINQNL